MKNRSLTILLWLILFSQYSYGQRVHSQEIELFVSNTLLGGVTAAAGAIINKKNYESTWLTFLKGFKYGCLGGALVYGGKKCSNLILQGDDKEIAGAWGGKLLQNAGSSIVENASLNRQPFSHYNLYMGFVRFEFDWQHRFCFSPKLMPITMGALLYSAIAFHGHLDIAKSLKLGTPVISTSSESYGHYGLTLRSNISIDFAAPRTQGYFNYLKGHEIVHVLQSQEYYAINTLFDRPLNNFKKKHRLINNVSKFVYFDFSFLDVNYFFAKKIAAEKCNCYWVNPYEFEAEHMVRNQELNMSLYCP